MTLIRIGLLSNYSATNSLTSLNKLQGQYGIECFANNGQIEFFLFINDKHIKKIIQSDSKEQLAVYLTAFGIQKEDFENIEILEDTYLLENLSITENFLKGYFDFSNVNLTNLLPGVTNNKAKYLYNKTEKSLNTSYSLHTDIISYLQTLNLTFVIQFYCSNRKNNFFISGQLVILGQFDNSDFFFKSINEKISNLSKKYNIEFKIISKYNFINQLSLKKLVSHSSYKKYVKSPLIINEILKIPNLQFLKYENTNYCENQELTPPQSLDDGIPIGFKIVPGLKHPSTVKLLFDDLSSHFCCFGITAQGKSRLMYNFLSLIDKTKKNFLVIDPKGEYFEALANTHNPIKYFKVGSLEFPLTINIFSVPKGLSPDNHIQFIYSLLLSIMGDEITPQMNRLLFRAVEYVIGNNGNMKNFVSALEHPEKLQVKGSYLDMSGNAVINRILPLIIGPAKNCFFTNNSSINFLDITSENVIIDLSNFELVESTLSRKVFVNTFLHYFIHAIRYQNTAIRNVGDISNFIILEEIQKIAPLTFQGRNEINSFIGLAPWTVRAYGICMGFVGTDPNVETPIITNTGLSMIFYSKSNIEKMLKLLGVPYTEYMNYLKDIQERKKFLLCYKGKITLIRSFDFIIPNGELIKDRYQYLLDEQVKN